MLDKKLSFPSEFIFIHVLPILLFLTCSFNSVKQPGLMNCLRSRFLLPGKCKLVKLYNGIWKTEAV